VQRAFADYLARLPTRLRRRIVSGQAMYGQTGDNTPWHGRPSNASFDISAAQWTNFTHALAPAICATFAGNATTDTNVPRQAARAAHRSLSGSARTRRSTRVAFMAYWS
jgi:hypothetical protein